jgi:AcrR family transcriptional regulator
MDRDCAHAVERIVTRAVAQGRLPADTDASLAAHALQAYFHGLIQIWLTQADAFDLHTAARPLIATMIAGLVADPPRKLQSLNQCKA